MFEIEIADRQSLLEVDEAELREAIAALLRIEEVAGATLDVAIVDDAAIRVLNREHLGHDRPTDVVSFAYHEEQVGNGPARPVPRGRGLVIEGEVVASAETALARAAEFGWSARDELILYVVHGLLHVVGYDDTTEEERRLMRSRERAVLRERGVEPRWNEEVEEA